MKKRRKQDPNRIMAKLIGGPLNGEIRGMRKKTAIKFYTLVPGDDKQAAYARTSMPIGKRPATYQFAGWATHQETIGFRPGQ